MNRRSFIFTLFVIATINPAFGRENVDYIINALSVRDNIPIGTILPYEVGKTPPNGYLLCDGRELYRDLYPCLFKILNTVYGGHENTFNIPDLR